MFFPQFYCTDMNMEIERTQVCVANQQAVLPPCCSALFKAEVYGEWGWIKDPKLGSCKWPNSSPRKIY